MAKAALREEAKKDSTAAPRDLIHSTRAKLTPQQISVLGSLLFLFR